MLILTRKQQESIMIGDDIIITVSKIRGAQVAIGIQAPAEIAIHREEVYRRIQVDKNEEDES